jgi:hypothetical protein
MYDEYIKKKTKDIMAREKDRKKFVSLGEKRVRRALKDIKLIGNLSNRSNYSYTDEDAKKICKALQTAVAELKARFDRKGEEEEIEFKL